VLLTRFAVRKLDLREYGLPRDVTGIEYVVAAVPGPGEPLAMRKPLCSRRSCRTYSQHHSF
jgi:hypothetical protein